MPPTPLVVLEVDDNTPSEDAPYTCDVSVWSFADDFNLATRTAEKSFRLMHKAVCGGVFRGYPPNGSEVACKLFGGDEVTWIGAAELAGERPWLPAPIDGVTRTLHALFDTMDVAARHFGADRVRIVFAFS